MAFSEVFADKGEALSYEIALKRLTRAEKLGLIEAQNDPDAEYLTIYDRAGNPCGERPRAICHRQGLRHAVVHLWCVQETPEGELVWMQQRGWDRPLFPGLFDLTATGHIDPGETPLEAVLREAREEAGLYLAPDQLVAASPLLQRYERSDGGFDNEMAYVFLYRVQAPPAFVPGPEVERMLSVPFDALGKLCQGAERVSCKGEDFSHAQFSCLRRAEWARVKKLLKESRG